MDSDGFVVHAKENELPRASSPARKKQRQSLGKRVSFGHVELHTFLKDADRTPSPMVGAPGGGAPAAPSPEVSAGQGAQPVDAPAPPAPSLLDLAAADEAAADAAAAAAAAVPAAPGLADLLRTDEEASGVAGVTEADDDDDDVVFRPRAAAGPGGDGNDTMSMDFTQSYGPGIVLRAAAQQGQQPEDGGPAEAPLGQDASETMDFTRSYGPGILAGVTTPSGAVDDSAPPASSLLEPSPLQPQPQPQAPAAEVAQPPAASESVHAEVAGRLSQLTEQVAAGAADGAGLSYETFLANHGIRFLDDAGAAARPGSLGGDACAELGFSAEEAPEEAQLAAAAALRPHYESVQWGAEQLAASCAQIRAAIAHTEEHVASTGGFFEHLPAREDELHALKATCRLGALSMWHEWRAKLETSNAKILSDSEGYLLADLATLESLLGAVREASARVRGAADDGPAHAHGEAQVELEGARARLREQADARERARARAADARAAADAVRAASTEAADGSAADALGALEAELGELQQKHALVTSALAEATAAAEAAAVAPAAAADPATSAAARARELAVLRAALGWRPCALSTEALELSFDALGLTLRARLASAPGGGLRLRAAPKLERAPGAADAEAGAAPAPGSVLAAVGEALTDLAVSEVAKELGACTQLASLPAAVTRVATVVGRAAELRAEIERLSAPYAMHCTRDPIVVGGLPGSAPVLHVSFSHSAHALRFSASMRVDALTMPTQLSYQLVEVSSCPAGLSHGTVANCVLRAFEETRGIGPGRLTALLSAVRDGSLRACEQHAAA